MILFESFLLCFPRSCGSVFRTELLLGEAQKRLDSPGSTQYPSRAPLDRMATSVVGPGAARYGLEGPGEEGCGANGGRSGPEMDPLDPGKHPPTT